MRNMPLISIFILSLVFYHTQPVHAEPTSVDALIRTAKLSYGNQRDKILSELKAELPPVALFVRLVNAGFFKGYGSDSMDGWLDGMAKPLLAARGWQTLSGADKKDLLLGFAALSRQNDTSELTSLHAGAYLRQGFQKLTDEQKNELMAKGLADPVRDYTNALIIKARSSSSGYDRENALKALAEYLGAVEMFARLVDAEFFNGYGRGAYQDRDGRGHSSMHDWLHSIAGRVLPPSKSWENLSLSEKQNFLSALNRLATQPNVSALTYREAQRLLAVGMQSLSEPERFALTGELAGIQIATGCVGLLN